MFRALIVTVLFTTISNFGLAQSEAWQRVAQTGELRWCADTSGGAPYVFPDDKNPKAIIGFEVELVNSLARRLGKTILFVSHDLSEALLLANRIALLKDGRMVSLATPEEFMQLDDPEVRAFASSLVPGRSLSDLGCH